MITYTLAGRDVTDEMPDNEWADYPPNAERMHGGAGLPKQPETPTPLDGAAC